LKKQEKLIRIGYACLAIAVPGSDMKSCNLKNAARDHLISLIGHNLDSLEKLIDYNIDNRIGLFRISSDLIPFGSSAALDLPWESIYSDKLAIIGCKIIHSGMRVSMHPGQYTVLNSPTDSVVEKSIQDLAYHAKVLDSMNLGPEHKLVLHVGGVYNDKNQAKKRFITCYNGLASSIKKRLVLENDGVLFNISDVLEIADAIGIPVVYDNLHHATNPADSYHSDYHWIKRCTSTWGKHDGPQKVHYSQQHTEKRRGAHSEFISIDSFLAYYRQFDDMELDIMLEVKDKNMSALKCIHCTNENGINVLEVEWSRYKYYVLEKSPEIYNRIRQLLRDKKEYPALPMYQWIEEAFHMPFIAGFAVNAIEHVWGYFKYKTNDIEKKRFQSLMQKFIAGETSLQAVKNNLLKLAGIYHEDYLLKGYYFYM